jgi:hypothetical protein
MLNAVKSEKIKFRRYKTFSIKMLPLGKNPEKPRNYGKSLILRGKIQKK